MVNPTSATEALDLLRFLGASNQLLRHGEIVGEVATEISKKIITLGIQHDGALVIVGAVLHDAGKVVHPEELVGPGREHEAAGERLLRQHGLSTNLAAVCRTHGAWADDHVPLEDRLIALGDCLWKGERCDKLEGLVTHAVAERLGVPQWEAFVLADPIFEKVASGAAKRLSRART